MPFGIDDAAMILNGVGALGGLFGGNKAAKQQAYLQQQALAETRRANREAERLQNEQIRMAIADIINERGGRRHYDKSSNTFSYEPSGVESALMSASDAEELQRLTTDARMRRDGLRSNAARRREEGKVADSMLAPLRDFRSPVSRDAIVGKLMQSALNGLARGNRTVTSAAARQALRGDSAGSMNINRMASDYGRDAAEAMLQAEIQGMGLFQDLDNSFKNNATNRYNTMASRASNFDDVAFQPVNIDGDTSSMAQGASSAYNSAAYGALGRNQLNRSAMSDYNKAAGDYANNSAALFPNLMGGLGDILENYGKRQKKNQGAQ